MREKRTRHWHGPADPPSEVSRTAGEAAVKGRIRIPSSWSTAAASVGMSRRGAESRIPDAMARRRRRSRPASTMSPWIRRRRWWRSVGVGSEGIRVAREVGRTRSTRGREEEPRREAAAGSILGRVKRPWRPRLRLSVEFLFCLVLDPSSLHQ